MPDPERPIAIPQPVAGSGGPSDKPDWNKQIKAYYDAIVSEPLPEDMRKLMATLAKSIRR